MLNVYLVVCVKKCSFAADQNYRRYAAKYHVLPCIIRLYVIIDYLLLSLLDTTLQMTKIISC